MEMIENHHRLKIVGDNNHIKIEKNFGIVVMIGNNCYVDVQQNFGSLQTISGNHVVIVNTINDYSASRGTQQVRTNENENKSDINSKKQKDNVTLKTLVNKIVSRLKFDFKSCLCVENNDKHVCKEKVFLFNKSFL